MDWSLHFTYDTEAGVLLWKERERTRFKLEASWACFNKKWANKPAGHKMRRPGGGPPKCVLVEIDGKGFSVHRIVWEMHNGPIPPGMEIDHIDCDPWNNRLTNLRLATHMQNMGNQKTRKHNRLGVKGVYALKNGKFGAFIRRPGMKPTSKTFNTIEEAHRAYVESAVLEYGEFARAS